jgi:hypothetical protein
MKKGRLAATALLAAGMFTGGAVMAAPAAHATTVYGLCLTDVNPISTCARQTSTNGPVDAWARDISGDPNQQFQKLYEGQVSSQNCWPFTCGSGFNSSYNGDAVYRLYNINSGRCIAPDNPDIASVYSVDCNANGVNWVWTPEGYLVNVYQTNLAVANGVSIGQVLVPNQWYNPMYIANPGFNSWALIAGT